MSEEPVRVFLHLPKTGGHTFARMIELACENAQVLPPLNQSARLNPNKKDTEWIAGSCLVMDSPHLRPRPLIHGRKSYRWYTVMRDPADRILSYWYQKNRGLREEGKAELDWNDFLLVYQSGRVNLPKLIGGRDGMQRCAIVGIQERFEQFVRAVEEDARISLPRIDRINANPSRPPIDSEPPERIRQIQRATVRERELYELAKERAP